MKSRNLFKKINKIDVEGRKLLSTVLVYLLMLTIALPAFTQPLEKFCLIQTSQSGESFAEMVDISFKSVKRNFTVKGKSYRLVSGKDHVELQDENGKLLEMEMARQEEGGFIEDFVFHKSHSQQVENDKSITDGDTLLIEGGTDYVVRIQLEDSIPKLYDIEKYVNLKFKAGGQSYRLVTEGYKRGFGKYGDKFGFLGLVDGQNRIITSISIQIPSGSEFFHIYDLALSKNGWLWVDGSDADYLVHVDLNTTPPTFGAPLELSKLTQTECWPGSWFFGCAATKGYYSRALERVFVSTRKHTFFGLLPLIKRQIIDGEPKELPDELKNAKLEKFSYWEDSQLIIFRDLPSLNGAVFFGEEGGGTVL